jgi:hypothetical protein
MPYFNLRKYSNFGHANIYGALVSSKPNPAFERDAVKARYPSLNVGHLKLRLILNQLAMLVCTIAAINYRCWVGTLCKLHSTPEELRWENGVRLS